MRLATSIARGNLVSLGTCFGKFSKSGKFKLHVTCLDWISGLAKYKVRLSFSSFDWCREVDAGVFVTEEMGLYLGMGEAEWGDAFPIRKPRRQSTFGEDNGGYPRAPGCRSVLDEGCTSRTSPRFLSLWVC